MHRSLSVLLALSCLILTQEDSQARRPGEARNPFAKSAERPGIFTGAVERRKAAREQVRREAAEAKAPAKKGSVKSKSTNKKPVVSKKTSQGAKKAPVRMVRKGDPGRRGKGGSPLRRRRTVLQPLFGQ